MTHATRSYTIVAPARHGAEPAPTSLRDHRPAPAMLQVLIWQSGLNLHDIRHQLPHRLGICNECWAARS